MFGLRAEDSCDYVKRVALGSEPLDTVIPSLRDGATLSFVITGHLLAVFGRDNEEWWGYLTRIEEVYEAASAVDLDLLPALMLPSRRLTAPGAPEAVQC